jgi:hypothetical protein
MAESAILDSTSAIVFVSEAILQLTSDKELGEEDDGAPRTTKR